MHPPSHSDPKDLFASLIRGFLFIPTQYSFVLASKNTSKMKLYLLLYFLVQTNAFRVPLPYGTGVAYSGHGPGNEGIFDLIRTWFADKNYVQQEQGKINYEAKQSSFN